MFTCFSCARQNVASVMETLRENCPDISVLFFAGGAKFWTMHEICVCCQSHMIKTMPCKNETLDNIEQITAL